MSDTIESLWLACLQAHGYHLTAPRRVIVEMLLHARCALSPLEIYDRARLQYARMGLVTVYRTVEKLEELGLVQRVHQPCGCNMFIRAAQGHQHLLLCTSCGKAQFFSGDHIDPLIQDVEQQTRYHIKEHWLQFMGVCPECQASQDQE